MQLSNYILTENEDFKFVEVVFSPYTGLNTYTYKTLRTDLEVDDLVVVPTNKFHQVAKIKGFIDPLDITLQDFKYKWIIQKVDTTDYDKCVEMEDAVNAKLTAATRRAKAEELKRQVTEQLTAEERSETTKLLRL